MVNLLIIIGVMAFVAMFSKVFTGVNELRMELFRHRRLLERLAAKAGVEPDTLDSEIADLVAQDHHEQARRKVRETLGLSSSDAHDYVENLRRTVRRSTNEGE